MSVKPLPRENDKRVQDILKDPMTVLSEKAKDIYSYDDACLSREYDRKKPDPKLSEHQILMILVERYGR